MHLRNHFKKSSIALLTLIGTTLFQSANAAIDYLIINKVQVFLQEDNTPPVDPVFWYYNAGVTGDNAVTGGTIVYPNSGGPVTLTGEDGLYTTDGDDYFSQAALDAAFPNGEVTLSIVENGSTTDYGPFTITGDTYPDAPYFLNLEELTQHDGSQDFLIQWNAFPGAESDDLVVFQLYEPELELEVMLEVLPGTTTEIVIPGGSFQEFFSYDMELFFLKATDKLDTPETLFGYVSSVYTSVSLTNFGDGVNIPDNAVAQAVRDAVFIPEGNPISQGEMEELFSLTVESDAPIDLTGLEFASGLTELTLITESVPSFSPILDLASLQRIKLVAPPKDGLFFTHWSDGNQNNPRFIEITGSEDFGVQAQYSTLPLSPFAGGYSLIVDGVVTSIVNLPNQLNVEVGDPYELRFNYLILEEAILSGSDSSFIALEYLDSGLLPTIALEIELRIRDFRWILSTTNVGIDQATVFASSFGGLDTFEIVMTDSDDLTEQDFAFSNGTEQIIFLVNADSNQGGSLFNGPALIPQRTEDINWQNISTGSATIISTTPNSAQTWAILLSFLPGPNQSYRIEPFPSFLGQSQQISGFSTDLPTAQPGGSTEHIEINWIDPHSGSFETTYEVWRSVSNRLVGSTLVAEELTDTSFIDPGAAPGRNYFYWIRAVRDGLKADYSEPISSFRSLTIPEDLQATQGDFSDRIRITWTRVSGASTYSVYRSTVNDANTAELIATGIVLTEYDDFSPDTDDLFYYWVSSEAFGTSSGFNQSVSGYRVADGINTVRASDGLYNDRVEINWDAFEGASTYTLYRNTINDSGSASILAENISETQFNDPIDASDQGIRFFYWVRPQIGGGLGSFSNADSGYIPVPRVSPLLAWGDNDFDQTSIPDVSSLEIVAIAAGANHSLALGADGTVVAWGRNEFGQATPPFGLSDVIDIAVGYDHSLALKRDGTVVAWGRNSFGKATVPAGLMDVIDIEGGAEHSLVLLSDGQVVGWGSNDLGQTEIPEELSEIVQISAGGYHNLARRADGTVVTWGDNRYGQQDIPERITQVIDIAAGWNHNLVLLPDGTVDGWGDNSRGQLDFPEDTQVPLQAKGLVIRDPVTARIVDISGGLFHSLGLSEKGELAAWGEDKNSQTDSPENLGRISQIDAGDEFNLSVQESPVPAIESLIPGNSELLFGEDVVLRVRATGGPDIAYQWFFNDQPVPGASSDALLLSNVSSSQQGSYQVKVSSGGNEVSSDQIQIEVTSSQATITSQTVRAIRTYTGEYIFSPVDTDPPGLELAFRSADETVLPSTTGTHTVSIDVAQNGFEAAPVEDVTMILEALTEEPMRLVITESGVTVRYLAPEGFSSTLQMSADMRDWITIAKVGNGNGQLNDLQLPSPAEPFFRILFGIPETD